MALTHCGERYFFFCDTTSSGVSVARYLPWSESRCKRVAGTMAFSLLLVRSAQRILFGKHLPFITVQGS